MFNKANLYTTLAGLIGAISTALIPVIQGHGFDSAFILPAISIACLGVLAKQFNVTGGTVPQDMSDDKLEILAQNIREELIKRNTEREIK